MNQIISPRANVFNRPLEHMKLKNTIKILFVHPLIQTRVYFVIIYPLFTDIHSFILWIIVFLIQEPSTRFSPSGFAFAQSSNLNPMR